MIAHPQYPGYGYFPSDPNHLYRLPQPASVTGAGAPPRDPSAAAQARPAQTPITIINGGPSGTSVDYVINGVAYHIEAGERQQIEVGPRPTIAYSRTNFPLKQRYTLSAGAYEFRLGGSGWSLYQVGPTP